MSKWKKKKNDKEDKETSKAMANFEKHMKEI